MARGFDLEDVEVDVRTLDSLIAASPLAGQPVHFLKVDVEGAEFEVLAGLDLGAIRPWIIVVESTVLLSAVEAASDVAGLLA